MMLGTVRSIIQAYISFDFKPFMDRTGYAFTYIDFGDSIDASVSSVVSVVSV